MTSPDQWPLDRKVAFINDHVFTDPKFNEQMTVKDISALARVIASEYEARGAEPKAISANG